ncbi:60S ribosomal protein L7 [Sarcoptes scabiei]|nr:60S ribosomal protein L7 [Sarcoptes scabiei]
MKMFAFDTDSLMMKEATISARKISPESEKILCLNTIEKSDDQSDFDCFHAEDIYEDLCYVTLRPNSLRSKSSNNTDNHEPMNKRDYCIKELIETESNYCDALEMIIQHFINPLSKVIDSDQTVMIFNNLQSLAELHRNLLDRFNKTLNFTRSAINKDSVCRNNIFSATSMPNLIDAEIEMILMDSNHLHKTRLNNSNSFLNFSKQNTMIRDKSEKSALTIAKLFLNMKDRFLIYGDYCANLPKAQKLLDRLCSDNLLVSQCISRCQNSANQGRFKLRDLLSLPMQRILKYHLLLGELLRQTDSAHSNFDELKKAHELMLDIGSYINEVKRDTEIIEIIRDIQRSIVDLSMPENYELKDYGRLHKDGEVKLHHSDSVRSRLKNRYIFIFDRVLLICKALKNSQYSYKEALVLDEYKIDDMSNFSPIHKFTKNWPFCWSLIPLDDHSIKQSYSFFVKSEECKQKWIEALERAQENVRPRDLSRSDHKFTMSTLPPTTCCHYCKKLLKGTWYQGYLCYVCNTAVHKNCISSVRSCSSIVSDSRKCDQKDFDHFTQANTLLRANLDRKKEINHLNGDTPTPFRMQRILVKASSGNDQKDQLVFQPNDIIIVFTNNDEYWYGRNVRTGEQGLFPPSLVTELVADSPASSSVESPTVATCSVLRFSYDDPLPESKAADFTIIRKHPDESPNMDLAAQISRIYNVPCSAITNSDPRHSFEPVTEYKDRLDSVFIDRFGSSLEANHDKDAFHRLFLGNGFNLEEYAWFAGLMDRQTAQKTLIQLAHGSFLVRVSPKQCNNYAISINYKGQIQHLRIQATRSDGMDERLPSQNHQCQPLSQGSDLKDKSNRMLEHFYLSERRYFQTIADLVHWHEKNSLSESFHLVDTQLLMPYKKAYCHQILGHAIALYAFTGTSTVASSFLSLRKGDRITVLSRAAQDRGWWKGEIGDRIGYFPYRYVNPTTNLLKVEPKPPNDSPSSNTINFFQCPVASLCTEIDNKLEKTIDTNTIESSIISDGLLPKALDSIDHNSKILEPSLCSRSDSSSASASSATTLSSPINSDSGSMNSCQASQAFSAH